MVRSIPWQRSQVNKLLQAWEGLQALRGEEARTLQRQVPGGKGVIAKSRTASVAQVVGETPSKLSLFPPTC